MYANQQPEIPNRANQQPAHSPNRMGQRNHNHARIIAADENGATGDEFVTDFSGKPEKKGNGDCDAGCVTI